MNVWRENAVDIYKAIVAMLGADYAHNVSQCVRVPSRPLVGRWGRIGECETYVLSGAYEATWVIFEAVLTKAAQTSSLVLS